MLPLRCWLSEILLSPTKPLSRLIISHTGDGEETQSWPSIIIQGSITQLQLETADIQRGTGYRVTQSTAMRPKATDPINSSGV